MGTVLTVCIPNLWGRRTPLKLRRCTTCYPGKATMPVRWNWLFYTAVGTATRSLPETMLSYSVVHWKAVKAI